VNTPPGSGAGIGWVRLRSSTHVVPVVQEADRDFQFVLTG
jgi:hypothetical protein